jgi:hypothetical protein
MSLSKDLSISMDPFGLAVLMTHALLTLITRLETLAMLKTQKFVVVICLGAVTFYLFVVCYLFVFCLTGELKRRFLPSENRLMSISELDGIARQALRPSSAVRYASKDGYGATVARLASGIDSRRERQWLTCPMLIGVLLRARSVC